MHLADESSEAVIGPQPLGLVEHGNGDGCSHFAERLAVVVQRRVVEQRDCKLNKCQDYSPDEAHVERRGAASFGDVLHPDHDELKNKWRSDVNQRDDSAD